LLNKIYTFYWEAPIHKYLHHTWCIGVHVHVHTYEVTSDATNIAK